jgi:hypothetical protein
MADMTESCDGVAGVLQRLGVRDVTGWKAGEAPDAGCALPLEGIPAALDAAITGPADKDRPA